MVFVLTNQDLIMPDQAAISPVTEAGRADTATPASALSPSKLAAVVEARYILELRRR
jgi:hypothetical protein